MKFLKRFLSAVLAASLLMVPFAGCSGGGEAPKALQYNADGTVVLPEDGEEVAVITVKDYGKITIRFFAEEAPKTVENFIGLAKKGYYDNITVHRIVKDFMIQSGDPRGDGTGGQSLWGGKFEDEFSNNLYNYTGSVSMANAGVNTNGSQFFINEGTGTELTEDYYNQLIAYNKDSRKQGVTFFDQSVKDLYAKVGGNSLLDGIHTVFGQVIDGMDVVHAIASADIKTGTEAPAKDIIVESVKIEPYKAAA